jgi:RsiW-degrading membrane proteinase PrsW (M82 family)
MPANFFIFLFNPLPIIINISQRSFFPGKSFFFWLLVALSFYIIYLYSISKNKKDFLKSQYIRSASLSIAILFISFILINVLISDPERKSENVEVEKTVQDLLKEDKRLFQNLELNFTNSNLHYEYLQHHFSIPAESNEPYEGFVRDEYSIINFYYDHIHSEEQIYSDNAKLGLGITFFNMDSLQTSLSQFNSISDKKFPFINYYKAKIYLQLSDTANALSYYKLASKVKDRVQNEASYELIDLLYARGNTQELYYLLNTGFSKKYYSKDILFKIYFLNNKITEYFSLKIEKAFNGFKWTGFVAAFIILLIWGFYMLRWDVFEKESNIILFLTLISGMILAVLCFYLYDFLHYRLDFHLHQDNLLMYSIFGIGVVEEFVKILPVLFLLTFGNRIISEPYDYILFAAVSALGFSFVENLVYFDGNLNGIIHGRALTSVPGHIIDSSIVAYGLVLAKYRYKSLPAIAGFAIFFLLGCINHGLYDYWLFTHLTIFFIIGFIVSISVWIIIINNCLNNSPSFNHHTETKSDNTQLIISISLLSILVLEYILVALENGPTYANGNFNKNLIIAGIMITYYSSRLTNMDLVKGYWATVPLRSVGEKKSNAAFEIKNFLLRLLSGDTFNHSFVHQKVVLGAHIENEKLSVYFNQPINGYIIDRLVVTCSTKKGELYEDPYWFRLETSQPINVGGASEQIFLFRFEDNRPSFEKDATLVIYLFALKDNNELLNKVKRDDLRALGKAFITSTNK